MNARPTPLPDRLIWLSLLATLAAAFITGQARANLHAGARASTYAERSDRRPGQADWCAMRLEVSDGALPHAPDASRPAGDAADGDGVSGHGKSKHAPR